MSGLKLSLVLFIPSPFHYNCQLWKRVWDRVVLPNFPEKWGPAICWQWSVGNCMHVLAYLVNHLQAGQLSEGIVRPSAWQCEACLAFVCLGFRLDAWHCVLCLGSYCMTTQKEHTTYSRKHGRRRGIWGCHSVPKVFTLKEVEHDNGIVTTGFQH